MLKLQYFGHLMQRTDSLEKTLMLGKIEGRRRWGQQRMRSLSWWTWVWASSESWWWTGKPGMLQSTGLQRVGHDWVTELNWWWPHRMSLRVFLPLPLKKKNFRRIGVNSSHLDRICPWSHLVFDFCLLEDFLKFLFIYLFYFWLYWVFIDLCGLSLVAARGTTLPCSFQASHWGGFSHWRAQALGCTGFSGCSTEAE